jgi:hypothetical protein
MEMHRLKDLSAHDLGSFNYIQIHILMGYSTTVLSCNGTMNYSISYGTVMSFTEHFQTF